MQQLNHITESARQTPIAAEVDLVVIGGSGTGVCAAVAAARLGMRVALVELGGQLGGNAALGLVSVWHSLWNTTGDRQIISGLVQTIVDRLRARGAAIESGRADPNWQFAMTPAEIACELDNLACEHGIQLFLHARLVAAQATSGTVQAVVIEDADGRRAIRARYAIDASGDATLVRLAGGSCERPTHLQPPTTAAILSGLDTLQLANPGFNLNRTVFDQSHPSALRPGFLWHAPLAGTPQLRQVFGSRVHGADCASAADLTQAEIAGRRQIRQMLDVLRDRYPAHPVRLVALPARIGIRETRHARCLHRLTEQEVLHGVRFPDAIANGSYRVDIHSQNGDGLTFRYLDGREVILDCTNQPVHRRWREPTPDNPTFYQIPFRSLVPVDLTNVLVAGRCLDADQGAFGAVRVQVTCNQLGEAAGTAIALAARRNVPVASVDVAELRQELQAKGAAVI